MPLPEFATDFFSEFRPGTIIGGLVVSLILWGCTVAYRKVTGYAMRSFGAEVVYIIVGAVGISTLMWAAHYAVGGGAPRVANFSASTLDVVSVGILTETKDVPPNAVGSATVVLQVALKNSGLDAAIDDYIIELERERGGKRLPGTLSSVTEIETKTKGTFVALGLARPSPIIQRGAIRPFAFGVVFPGITREQAMDSGATFIFSFKDGFGKQYELKTETLDRAFQY